MSANKRPTVASGPATASNNEASAGAGAAGAGAPQQQKMSSQMEAVMRVMTGQQERTIAQKLADSNRPTWEQYKKDNHDKLNLEGVDTKKMAEYRAQLDKDRDRRLARGTTHKSKSSKKSKKDRKKDKKRKRRKEYDTSSASEDEEDDSEDSSRSDEDRKRKRKDRKRSKKKEFQNKS